MARKPLKHTAYREPQLPNNVRSGAATRAEVGLDLESYHQPLAEFLASVHGAGIVSGLKVIATENNPGLLISPGEALDANGRSIVLTEGGRAEIGANADAAGAAPQLTEVKAEGVRLPTAGLTGNRVLLIRWWETFDRDGFDDSGAHRTEHTPWLQLADVNPFLLFQEPLTRIPLCAIKFGQGAEAGQVKSILAFRAPLTTFGQSLSAGIQLSGIQFRAPQIKSFAVEDAVVASLRAGSPDGITLSAVNAEGEQEISLRTKGNAWELGASLPMLYMGGWQIKANNLHLISEDPGGIIMLEPKGTRLVLLEGEGTARRSVSLSPDRVDIPGQLVVEGTAHFRGGKVGYVTDAFRNSTATALERGDVVVIGPHPPRSNSAPDIPVPEVEAAARPYDKRLCGVVSDAAAPGEQGQMVTLGCWAHCKVDADLAPIESGDLLTTSPTPGHAQKVTDDARATGAVLGKALAPLAAGKGSIPVLVTLH